MQLKNRIIYYFSLLIINFFSSLLAHEKGVKPICAGNLSLPLSQQPAPVIAFGQNIVDKGDLNIFAHGNQLGGNRKSFSDVVPVFRYGILDRLVALVEVPIAVKFKQNDDRSKGLQDVLLEFEAVLFDHKTLYEANKITLVGNIGLPTGSAFKNPPTGFGAPSFFLGVPLYHRAIDWYCFMSPGITITTSHKKSKSGNQFLYEFGFGKNIAYKSERWILTWIVELDGLYKQRDMLCGARNENSGGNMVLITPSLWFSTQHLTLQVGVAAVAFEHLFGNQNKDRYYVTANLGWKFNGRYCGC